MEDRIIEVRITKDALYVYVCVSICEYTCGRKLFFYATPTQYV